MFRVFVALALLLLGTALPAGASDDIRAADNAIALEIGITDLNYVENFGGSKADTERGWLPTATLSAGLLASESAAGPLRNLYLHLDLTGGIGSTAYAGALCNVAGACFPATASTDDSIYAVSMQIGRGLPFGPRLMLIPYAQLDYRYWDRDVGGAGGYGEAYTDWAALAGLMAQYSPAPRWVWTVSSALGTTFGANMFDGTANYPLGSALTWQTKAKVGLRITSRIELTGSIGYDHFEFGQSPVVVEPGSSFCAAGCIEPHSTTDQLTLMSGIAYHF